jgi:hypothetical protein
MPKLSTSQKLLLTLFLGLIFLYSFNQLKESDAFYHLKTGQFIWEAKTIPHSDIFSYTALGSPWVTHEWLAEVIFYLVQNLTGFWGLLGFTAFIAFLVYFFIFRLALKKGAEFNLTLILLFGLGYFTFKFFIPRPQIFAYLAFVILIYLLESYRQKPKSKYLWLILFDIWFWVNINASFILGLVVIAFYAIAEWLKSKTIPKNLLIATGAATLISFINPNTYKIFLYSLYVKPAAETLKILEWKSIIYSWRETEPLIFLIEMALAGAFLIWWFYFRKQSQDMVWLGLVMGISILPFISLRHYVFWPMAAIAPLAVAVSGVLKEKLKDFPWQRLYPVTPVTKDGALEEKSLIGHPSLSQRVKYLGCNGVYVPVLTLGLIFLIARYLSFPRSYINDYQLPVAAADFIGANYLRGPLFNLYNEGGYLIWRFWPKEKIFIDGRSEVFGPTQLDEFFTVVGSLPGWEKLVDEKYKINYFILAYWPQSLSKSIQPLILNLVSKNWQLVFWDDAALVFARPDKENQPLIEKYSLKHINPFRDPKKIPREEAEAAAQEMRRLLERSPRSLIVEDYARKFLSSH